MTIKQKLKMDTRPTRFPSGSLKELTFLSIPLILSSLSASLLEFFDRLFLSQYSLNAWNAASMAASIAFFFQMACMMVVVLSRAYIGQYLGANKPKLIGEIVWQMIWFSFFSMLITYPASFLAERYFFYHTEIESSGLIYFRCLAAANFLYPLSAALSAFFLSQGKTRIIFLSNLFIQGLNVTLDYFLIFGVKGLFPPLGTFGAAIATVISQATLCIILFIAFSAPKYINSFRTDIYKLKFKLLWEILKTGTFRSVGRLLQVSAWILASRIMIQKGEDFLAVHTLGTSLFLIFAFINDGMGEALVTITSYIIGAKENQNIERLIRNSFYFLFLIMGLLAIPFLAFQDHLIYIFFSTSLSETTFSLLKAACTCMWLALFANGINRIGVSFVIATRDTFFYACSTIPGWFTLFVPIYFGIGSLGWSPQVFFIIDALNALTLGLIFILRFKRGSWKTKLLPITS